jgi:hypothetical protein
VEKYGEAEQTTDDNIIQRMRFALWITKATRTHTVTHSLFVSLSQNVLYLLLFFGNNGFANAPSCYVVRTLPVLFMHS